MINLLITNKKLIIALASVLIFGCSSPSKIDIHAPDYVYNMNFNEELIGGIDVLYVHEPSSTSELYKMGVTAEKFKTALDESLKLQHLKAIEALPRHRLTVSFLDNDESSLESDLYYETKVRYVLVESATNKVVFNSLIISRGESASSDYFLSSARHKIAVERSVDQNIRDFLTELSSKPEL